MTFSARTPNIFKDIEVGNPPSDGISSMAFGNCSNHLAVASWDNQVRIYNVADDGTSTTPLMFYHHQAPVLSVTWTLDGLKVISGGADNVAYAYDIMTGQATQVAKHAQPIKVVKVVNVFENQTLITGGWDSTIKYWDHRSPKPIITVELPGKCYSMDATDKIMVAATSEQFVSMIDLRYPHVIEKNGKSPLKWQSRVIRCFPDSNCYAVGSIEGRVGINYVNYKDASKSFSFKCHREENNIYAVNDISVHPLGTFATCGSDGSVNFWDKNSRQRLSSVKLTTKESISCTAFNKTGSLFAYAISYDWSRGYKYASLTNSNPNKIMLRKLRDDDFKPKERR